MTTTWTLQTHGDPLQRIRRFLLDVWSQAELVGMLLPVYNDESSVSPRLVEDPSCLSRADPCVPFMPANMSKMIIDLAQQQTVARLGAVLRSCELRALQQALGRQPVDLSSWLIIGIDCLSSFPEQDLEWRIKKAGTLESLTRQNLQNARQGGISPHRFRMACQMCTSPAIRETDANSQDSRNYLHSLCICMIGMPVKESLLVHARDETISARLNLNAITDSSADPVLISDHQRVMETLTLRRENTLARLLGALSDDLPSSVNDLIDHLENCKPCKRCLEACPLYTGELERLGGIGNTAHIDDTATDVVEPVIRWLTSCVFCGMCEQACPKELPLTAIIHRINLELEQLAV